MRSNIVFDFGEQGRLCLYSHHLGSHLAQHLADALDSPPARSRWYDPEYLVRIICEHMFTLEGNSRDSGWGLSMFVLDQDPEVFPICVHLDDCEVSILTPQFGKHATIGRVPYEEWIDEHATREHAYTVAALPGLFVAESSQDAVRQAAEWLAAHSHSLLYEATRKDTGATTRHNPRTMADGPES